MGRLARSVLSEREAAAQFLIAMFLGVRDSWTSIATLLHPLMIDGGKLASPSAEFEFSLATISMQLRAVDHVFAAAQAKRIREHVLECLLATEPGEAAIEALGAYDRVWAQSLAAGHRPLGAVAATFCRRVGLDAGDLPAGAESADSVFAITLGDAIATSLPGWWKTVIKTREIVV